MKRYILPALFCLFAAYSCIDDESSLPAGELQDIVIGNINETYNILSYEGNKLELSPVIDGFEDDELEFAWYLADNTKIKPEDYDSYIYQGELISNERNLSYEVNLKPGLWYVLCKVTSKKYGYTGACHTAVTVSTSFTEGFYLLKETAEGNTELDFYNARTKGMIPDVLAAQAGLSLKGKPQSLSPIYYACYLDEEDKATGDNAIFVTSQDGEFGMLRTSDLKTIKDRSNILYEPMPADEKVYGMWRTILSYYLVTDKGTRSVYGAEVMGDPHAGIFGVAQGNGGSRFHTYDPMSSCNTIWDETNHTIYYVDYNDAYYTFNNEGFPDADLSECECLSVGRSDLLGRATLLFLNQKTGNKELYQISDRKIADLYVAPAESHLAKATHYTVNTLQSAIMYVVDDNKVYGHRLEDHMETAQPYTLDGLPTGEQICYISNQFYTSPSDLNKDSRFDYLIVGTQSGSTYKVYMYETVGGQPKGKPLHTITGEGKFSSIRFVGENAESPMDEGVFYSLSD